MKKTFTLLFAALLVAMSALQAQTIWTGPDVTFTRGSNVNHLLPSNHDTLTGNVIIARSNAGGIFNLATESSFTMATSPAGTEWAVGTTANISTLTFQNWLNAIGGSGSGGVPLNQDMVLHLIADNIYIDIKFTAWATKNAGSGYTYVRSSPASAPSGLNENTKALSAFRVFVDNSGTQLSVKGVLGRQKAAIFDVSGRKRIDTFTSNQEPINIAALPHGIYFIRVGEQYAMRFVKR